MTRQGGRYEVPTLYQITDELDRLAMDRSFGSLQDRRKRIHNLGRKPSNAPFSGAKNEAWTFHNGGREELQFNLGIEDDLPGGDFRYGVAFSFEPSRSMPDIDTLLPLVARFNDYVLENSARLSGLKMWHFGHARDADTRVGPYPPAPIAPELFHLGVFVFLGRIGSSADPDYEAVLETLEAFLPMWEFVVAGPERAQAPAVEAPLGQNTPSQRTSMIVTRKALLLDVGLRHNAMQRQLFDDLVATYGGTQVDVEFDARGGGRVDAIVQTPTERILFEIKTASTARGCIREALGQLLDYGCWPGRVPATRLIVVGSPPADDDARAYLNLLTRRSDIPIEYLQVQLPTATS